MFLAAGTRTLAGTALLSAVPAAFPAADASLRGLRAAGEGATTHAALFAALIRS